MNGQGRTAMVYLVCVIIGVLLGIGVNDYIREGRIKEYEQKIRELEDQTNRLKGRLGAIENKEDIIREDVKREQANKTVSEVAKYWIEHYTRNRNRPGQ